MFAKYRNALPQLGDNIFLTDGGSETTFVFHDGIDLPLFAAFDMLRDTENRTVMKSYFRRYAGIARDAGTGFVLESATWRASSVWGDQLGYSAKALDAANRDAVEMLFEVRDEFEASEMPFVISGCIGPKGDGYSPQELLTPQDAEAYHNAQIETFADAGVDMVSALTMTHVGEAIGVTRAAQRAGVPVVISFTVETDGKPPSGQTLRSAIEQVDRETENGPVYFMINCAHPEHFEQVLADEGNWLKRIGGIRANASRCSHAELNEAEVLDDGNPQEFGEQYRSLMAYLPNLRVMGGCCGTDHRHVEAIAQSCIHVGT